MRLLAIDTSTRWGGAALLDAPEGAPRVVAEVGAFVEDSHAARTLPMVEHLLALTGWPKSSLDAYAAVRGPGAFTGVRVALGLVRGLAYSTGRPCVGVGSLDAMAEAWGPAAGDRVPLLDAGRGEVYGARFAATGSPPRAVIPAWVGDPLRALEGGGEVVLFGGGAASHEQRLREAGYRGPIGRAPTGVAAGAGRIALALLADRPGADIDFTPLYVRPSDAEVKFR
jgi:tRNA threonylcarbamoyladenosine biosynthesis protein TsaB